MPWQRGAVWSQCHLHQRDTASVSPRGNEAAAQTAGLTGSTEAQFMRAGPEVAHQAGRSCPQRGPGSVAFGRGEWHGRE